MAMILVVDGNSGAGNRISEILAPAGHQVIGVSSALEALGKIHECKFDIILLDAVALDNGDIDPLEAIKKRSPQTMMILIADNRRRALIPEAILVGVFDIIRKPIEPEALKSIVANALDEVNLMKGSGYIYKDSRRTDPLLLRDGLICAILDSLIVGLTFYLGFVLQVSLLREPLYFNTGELLFLSLGIAFCYSFVFVFKRAHRTDLIATKTELARHILRNLSFAYIMQLALLFIIKDSGFSAGRSAICLGYSLGLIGLFANRLLIAPRTVSNLDRVSEKHIVVTNLASAKPARGNISAVPSGHPALPKAVKKDHLAKTGSTSKYNILTNSEDAILMTRQSDIDELHLDGDFFSAGEILNLMDRLKGKKYKIVIHKKQNNSTKEAGQHLAVR
jgi:CheY-like chemotaxis protein